MKSIYAMLVMMWLLIIAGGGIAVLVLGSLALDGVDPLLTSALKGAVAIGMVVAWVVVLSRMKNWVFGRRIRH